MSIVHTANTEVMRNAYKILVIKSEEYGLLGMLYSVTLCLPFERSKLYMRYG